MSCLFVQFAHFSYLLWQPVHLLSSCSACSSCCYASWRRLGHCGFRSFKKTRRFIYGHQSLPNERITLCRIGCKSQSRRVFIKKFQVRTLNCRCLALHTCSFRLTANVLDEELNSPLCWPVKDYFGQPRFSERLTRLIQVMYDWKFNSDTKTNVLTPTEW